MVVMGGVVISYVRGTPVELHGFIVQAVYNGLDHISDLGMIIVRPVYSMADFERKGNTVKYLRGFHLKAGARIWP